MGGASGKDGRSPLDLTQPRKHLGAGSGAGTDDLADGELAVAPQVEVAKTTIHQQEFSALRAIPQGIKDHWFLRVWL